MAVSAITLRRGAIVGQHGGDRGTATMTNEKASQQRDQVGVREADSV
jgi:hypothetical protein